jgi:hypothetical protein
MDTRGQFQNIAVAQEKATISLSHGILVPRRTIQRDILSVYQRCDFVGVLLVEDDGVDSEVTVRDEWIVYNVLAVISVSIEGFGDGESQYHRFRSRPTYISLLLDTVNGLLVFPVRGSTSRSVPT